MIIAKFEPFALVSGRNARTHAFRKIERHQNEAVQWFLVKHTHAGKKRGETYMPRGLKKPRSWTGTQKTGEERTAPALRSEIGQSKSTWETPKIHREFVLTEAADITIDDAIRVLSRRTGTRPTRSHFLRAVLKAISHALPELEDKAGAIGILKRPSNWGTEEAALEREEYERDLARAIVAAIKASKQME